MKKLPSISVRQNRWDNIYGYVGRRKVVTFYSCSNLGDLALRSGGGYQRPAEWEERARRRLARIPDGTVLTVELTKEDAQEVAHKLGILADSPELQEDYHLSQEQACALVRSIPTIGGQWHLPQHALDAVSGEIADHCEVLRDIAADARNSNETGQSLRIGKQAARLKAAVCERIASLNSATQSPALPASPEKKTARLPSM